MLGVQDGAVFTPPPSPNAPEMPPIFTGAGRLMVVPSPSWPSLLWPHVQTMPADVSAMLCSAPALTRVTPARPLTCTGASRFVFVRSPSRPYVFQPHAHTVPSERTARLWSRPPAMATMFARPCTCTGVRWLVVFPTPRLPPTRPRPW